MKITVSFTYLLPFSRGVYPQRIEFAPPGANSFQEEQILSFKSRPHFGRAMSTKEANRKSRKLFPFAKMAKRLGVYPYTLSTAYTV